MIMQRKLLVVCSVLVVASPVLAQNKINTTWHCPKAAAAQKMDVGDMPDHTFVLAQGECTATAGSKGLEEKGGAYTEFRDMKKTGATNHGRFIATLASGDKLFYTYAGSAPADVNKSASNKWTIDGGTGKFAHAKGAGTCSGKRNADESADWHCTGSVRAGK